MYDGKVVFKVDLDTKDFTPQLEKTKKDLDSLMIKYDVLKKKPVMDRTDKKNLEGFTEEGKLKVIAAANMRREKELLNLQSLIQQTANKYVDLKAKQDAVFKADYKKGLASIKNINMMDNAAYNKSYALQYNQLGDAMSKVSGELPYVADGFKDISKEAEDAGVKVEDAGKKGEKSGKLFDKGFKNGLKSVKKLALGIIGIRSAYMLARKAASAYMSQDEELANKMEDVWTGLGAFLAPLLEMLSELMLKFVGYLNVFIKALTGKDLIAAANAKILEKQAKAQEKLNKATKEYQNYDFDVIRVQQTDTSKSGSGSSEANLIDIPELNQSVVKKLQDLAKWLKENKDLIEAVGIALGVTFGAVAIANLLSNIGALIGSSSLLTGLAGLLAILSLLAIAWCIKIIIDDYSELKELNRIALETLDALNEIKGKTAKTIVENPEGKTPEQTKKAEAKFQELTYSDAVSYGKNIDKMIDSTKKYNNTLLGIPAALDQVWSAVTKTDTIPQQNAKAVKKYQENLQIGIWGNIELAKQGKLTEDGYKSLIYIMNNYGDQIDEINSRSEKYKFSVKELNAVIKDYQEKLKQADPVVKNFNNLNKEQQKQMQKTLDKYLAGEITAEGYYKTLEKIPKDVSTDVKTTGVQTSEKLANSYINVLKEVPIEKTTEFKADDKDAQNKIKTLGQKLIELPKKSLITFETKLDTTMADNEFNLFKQRISQSPFLATLLKKLSPALGFAGGGYISQPTFAMVGEGKYSEYVIPEGEDYISRLANEIGKYSGGSGVTNVYLDGRLIQRQVDDTRNRVNFTKNR